jgi:hypothetical protein
MVGLSLASLFQGTAVYAVGLSTPADLVAEPSAGSLNLRWSPVEGAGLYRVAVFDAPEKDGKRPLLAAVWVKGTRYLYGQTTTVPQAGKFPSTKPQPLPSGRRLRVMVAAALADGADKGEWAGMDVDPLAKAMPAAVAPTALPTPEPTISPTPASAPKEAELEVQGGEEFKQSPDAAVLDIDEGAEAGAGEGNGPAAGAAVLTSAATGAGAMAAGTAGESAKTASAGATPAGEAKALLAAGRFEQAETAYRAVLEKDPADADAWEGLGDSYAGRRMKLEAKESYEKALELNKSKTHLRSWIEKNVRR